MIFRVQVTDDDQTSPRRVAKARRLVDYQRGLDRANVRRPPREKQVRVRDAQAPAVAVLQDDELRNSPDASHRFRGRRVGGQELGNSWRRRKFPFRRVGAINGQRDFAALDGSPRVAAPGNSLALLRRAALQNERGVITFSS